MVLHNLMVLLELCKDEALKTETAECGEVRGVVSRPRISQLWQKRVELWLDQAQQSE